MVAAASKERTIDPNRQKLSGDQTPREAANNNIIVEE
jgi:hypothetical protein